ncbi:putative oxidoreductase YjhC OS=Escherichia coli (strain K12) GN=yjhC PE=3 SV=2 [Rhizoctonia solani AG-1 IB]|uniref:Putative oxidoreductase YjhC n=1 Tax=Thanatephorus cucumeris (strain AG1-IB / isolate 7/3/14) TaxID=1108050 RepID=A0A0B7FU96_THACB|nr:putative oxidoreductase YjhC OS=Escherichia coli (strain K12) GN=yjhC PE=3 SV=2 [Rhizoctonia solani AG-1 IB]
MDSIRKTMKSIVAGKSSAKLDPDFAPATEPVQNQIEEERPPIGPPVRLAVVGAGQRGRKYGRYALDNPKHCTVFAVAEPRPETRECMAQEHQLPPDRIFSDWKDLLAASDAHDATRKDPTDPRYVDGVVVTVQDHMHAEVVIPFAQRGYHILCEKPMATTPEECIRMADEVERSGVVFKIAHVLRYSKYNQALREVVISGDLGKLVNIVHVEPVGHYHFAHSYVRGNWNREAKSSFSLMTKSCHDIDLLCHLFAPATPVRFSSFGSLNHFTKSEKPVEAGSAVRCLDCAVQKTCPYSASRIYLTGNTGWPVSAIVDGAVTRDKVVKELEDGPYGLCVYESPNDVCDHQVVNIEFSNGTTASFTMVAFTKLICERQTRIHLTHGEVIGDSNMFTTTNFRTNETQRHRPSFMDAHGDGDMGVIREFVRSVSHRLAKGNNQTSENVDSADDVGYPVSEVLRSHLAVFCAERARRTGTVVLFEDYEREVRQGMASSACGNRVDDQGKDGAGPKVVIEIED